MQANNGLSRRQFIGGTAGVAAGSAGLSCLASFSANSNKMKNNNTESPEVKNAEQETADSRPIRVGLINCDTHGMYYAALMDDHDPLLLMQPPNPKGAKQVHSWQAGGIHNYFYTSYYDHTEMTVPHVEGFKVVKVWDPHPVGANVLSQVLHGTPQVCKTFEEVSDDVDLIFVADCNGDGSEHLKLAKPGLSKGIPTFVDKPFAYELKDALKMVAIADKHKTPLMSLSMLRELPQAHLFRNRLAEVGNLQYAAIFGGGTALAGQIHAICLTQLFFGQGIQSVECMGRELPEYIHLQYGENEKTPEKGVMLNSACGTTPHCAIYASAYGDIGDVHSPPMGDYVFPFGAAEILRKVKKMVKTGKPQIERQEMIESIAVAEAARIALKEKRRVLIKDISQDRISP